ncbi:hypothetical protein RRG08_051306 [Elysia crispata]|uniref:Secreted protein n=1 Tax=Elysia crispata TaxID=231223 RepID=A0AAE0XS25_9GAST|nr:hypothetical protein RRG08_051306 [Elysia crispata]
MKQWGLCMLVQQCVCAQALAALVLAVKEPNIHLVPTVLLLWSQRSNSPIFTWFLQYCCSGLSDQIAQYSPGSYSAVALRSYSPIFTWFLQYCCSGLSDQIAQYSPGSYSTVALVLAVKEPNIHLVPTVLLLWSQRSNSPIFTWFLQYCCSGLSDQIAQYSPGSYSTVALRSNSPIFTWFLQYCCSGLSDHIAQYSPGSSCSSGLSDQIAIYSPGSSCSSGLSDQIAQYSPGSYSAVALVSAII